MKSDAFHCIHSSLMILALLNTHKDCRTKPVGCFLNYARLAVGNVMGMVPHLIGFQHIRKDVVLFLHQEKDPPLFPA
jgi:hypothetical protein